MAFYCVTQFGHLLKMGPRTRAIMALAAINLAIACLSLHMKTQARHILSLSAIYFVMPEFAHANMGNDSFCHIWLCPSLHMRTRARCQLLSVSLHRKIWLCPSLHMGTRARCFLSLSLPYFCYAQVCTDGGAKN